MRSLLGLFAATATTLGAAAVVADVSAQEVTLKAGVFVPPTTTYGIPFKRFVDHVNETGKGQLQIRIVGGPEAIPGEEQANAVRSGVLDMASTPPTYYKSVMVEGDAQTLTDMTVAEQRKSGGYAALSKLAEAKLNAMYLTTYGVGVPFHIYLTKEVTKADDMKGMRLRTQPIYNAVFKNLGITGTTIPAPEVFTALERGVIQGYGWPIWGIQDFGWDKMTKVRVEPGFYNVIVNVLVNKTRFAGLTDVQRKVLTDAADWFEKDMVAWSKQTTENNLAHQQKAGIKTVDLGAGFRKTANDLYWDDLQKLSPQSIGELRKLLSK